MRSLAWVVVGFGLVTAGCSGVKTGAATGPTGDLTLTEIVPAQGPLAGNVPVELHGTGFVAENLLVTFGGTAVGDAQLVDAQTIRGTLPPRSQAGAVDVVVASAAGQATLPQGFTYHDVAAMSISGINPPNGPLAGGTTVTITGHGFQGGATTVVFGSANGTGVTVASDSSLSVLTPAGAAAGAVSVTIHNNNGTASLPSAFVYGTIDTTGGTVTEHLGGISEIDLVKSMNDAPTVSGSAAYFAPSDLAWPAPGTCALDVNFAPGVTATLDAGANVTVTMGSALSSLPKVSSGIGPQYRLSGAAATTFVLNTMTGVKAPGATVTAFDRPTVAVAPSSDYDAYLDPFGVSNFTGGGFWSGSSDLWVSWTGSPVNHVQLYVIASDIAGNPTHILQCDLRDGGDQGALCIRGGGSGDLCQTPGATMSDLWTAMGAPGFGATTVALYRGNRSTYDIGGGTQAALDVNITKVTSLVMSN